MPGARAIVEVCSGVRAPVAVLHPGAATDDPAVDLLGERVRHRADRGPPVDHEADHHHEAGVAQDEVAGAVDRIDHPDPAASDARARVRNLLGQDDVLGKCGREPLEDQGVGGLVGLGHRLVAGLALDVQALAAIAAHQHGRLARDLRRDLQLGDVVAHRAPLLARSRVSAERPASSTRPARKGSVTVTSTGSLRPIRSEAKPIDRG